MPAKRKRNTRQRPEVDVRIKFRKNEPSSKPKKLNVADGLMGEDVVKRLKNQWGVYNPHVFEQL